jgi:hypothetical protein
MNLKLQLYKKSESMKNIIITAILLTAFVFTANSQEEQMSRKERREAKQEQKKEEIKNLITEKRFVFVPTHAMPLGGGSIFLSHSFEAEIKGDTLISYLPFYGVAYRVEYGGRNGGFDFTQPLEEYTSEQDDKGYQVNLEVKNKMDYLTYNFQISELGYATLNVTSTNRQAISFYGHIEAPEEDSK